MKQLLVLFALIAVGSSSNWKSGLRVRFDIGYDFGGSFFFDLPRTVSDAISQGWTARRQPAGLPVTSVTMYCYPDLVVCTFYDDEGDVAGLQIALGKDIFTPHYDMEQTGFTDWTVNGSSYWTLQQYFTTEEILSARRQRPNENQIIENGGIWAVGLDQVLYITNSSNAMQNEGEFVRQGCIPWMGTHYYYRLGQNPNCENPSFPWFALVVSGELVGSGFTVNGRLNLPSGQRFWFESPDVSGVKLNVFDAPQCLYDDVENYGVLTMHIYYLDQPWQISCMFE